MRHRLKLSSSPASRSFPLTLHSTRHCVRRLSIQWRSGGCGGLNTSAHSYLVTEYRILWRTFVRRLLNRDFQETPQCLSDFLMMTPGGTTNNTLAGRREKTAEHLMYSWHCGLRSQTSCRTLGKLLNESRCSLNVPSPSFLPSGGRKKTEIGLLSSSI